ncbi:hypothetical protein E2P81_ATG02416 [Venturia nashicola]|uniref:Uncharacterized protein n=1 Tax=Venturia nashicola TaxID=86259 RepID=A0A4Z1PKW0_9PEZI|nr:hypothetical protein E6O75_ATG02475 [Venturia nashicola]TLD36634.1 hypothetical protein E2P81_ATG02416 [Venturia nashicola]
MALGESRHGDAVLAAETEPWSASCPLVEAPQHSIATELHVRIYTTTIPDHEERHPWYLWKLGRQIREDRTLPVRASKAFLPIDQTNESARLSPSLVKCGASPLDLHPAFLALFGIRPDLRTIAIALFRFGGIRPRLRTIVIAAKTCGR